MSILALIVFLVLVGLAFWVVNTLGSAYGIPSPVLVTIQVLLVVLAVFYLLQAFGVGTGPMLRFR